MSDSFLFYNSSTDLYLEIEVKNESGTLRYIFTWVADVSTIETFSKYMLTFAKLDNILKSRNASFFNQILHTLISVGIENIWAIPIGLYSDNVDFCNDIEKIMDYCSHD